MDNQKRRVNYKDLSTISEEWNSICGRRDEAIEGGLDISLNHVTIPCIIEEIEKEKPSSIIDVGCGTGFLTSCLANNAETVGIDYSSKSIEIAQKKYKKEGLYFKHSKIEDFHTDRLFDVCVANMVFSSDPNWKCSIGNIFHLLSKRGCIVIVLPHPCFWPRYWNILEQDWFVYNEEIFIEHNFSITLAKSMGMSTYIHRPLEEYINGCIKSGFIIEKVKEPYPVGDIPNQYEYRFPRFIMIKGRKIEA